MDYKFFAAKADKPEYNLIPSSTIASLYNYVHKGLPPGSFVKAVLTNDLTRAVSYADLNNQAALVQIVKFCYNNIPMDCWGSEEEVQNWRVTPQKVVKGTSIDGYSN